MQKYCTQTVFKMTLRKKAAYKMTLDENKHVQPSTK